MRILNTLEKEICNKILKSSGPNNFIANIIDVNLPGVCILVNRNPKSANLLFTIKSKLPTDQETNYVIQKTEELSLFILQIVNLLKILEKDGYILLLERGSNSKENNKFGRCVDNLPNMSYKFSDQNIINLLCEYTNKEIYATDEFKRFCNNGYVARDEQRFKLQIKITQGALCVAIIALLFNVLINMKNKTPDSIKLDVNQFDTISKKLNSLEKLINKKFIVENTK